MKTSSITVIECNPCGCNSRGSILEGMLFIRSGFFGENLPFDRIRRITGYLVGTVDRFNNAKKAEVRDRVKHSLGTGSGTMEQV